MAVSESTSRRLRLGTRASALALWQARTVGALLEARGQRVDIVTIRTSGDRLQEAPLAEVGGKGLFVKEIQDALERREIDLAVHSAKDMPAVEKFLASAKPEFANYRKKSGGDDQVFIEAVDPKWGGELPFSVVYGPDGKKAKVLSGKQSYQSFEKVIARLLK